MPSLFGPKSMDSGSGDDESASQSPEASSSGEDSDSSQQFVGLESRSASDAEADEGTDADEDSDASSTAAGDEMRRCSLCRSAFAADLVDNMAGVTDDDDGWLDCDGGCGRRLPPEEVRYTC